MVFATTNWDLVEDLSSESSRQRDAALAEITDRNWKPVYAFLRGQGYGMHEADDLTQGFFCYVIEKELMNRAEQKKGKFRSFLIGSLKKFCSDQKTYSEAQKRSPKERIIALEAIESAESTIASQINDDPQKLFLRTWAQNLLDRVLNKLQIRSTEIAKPHLYDLVQKIYFNANPTKASYKELAEQHNMNLDQIGNSLRSAKQLYSSILREEVAQTVESQTDIDDEIRDIILVLQEKK